MVMRFTMLISFLTLVVSSIVSVKAGSNARRQTAFNPTIVPGLAHPAYLDLDTGASLAAFEYGNTSKQPLLDWPCTNPGPVPLLSYGGCLIINATQAPITFSSLSAVYSMDSSPSHTHRT